MDKLIRVFLPVFLIVIILGVYIYNNKNKIITLPALKTEALDPLTVEAMRKKSYPGSAIIIEENLGQASNYDQYIASYKSEGLKINGLLTVPQGDPPEGGWPAIILNHGYIAPEVYQTTERYGAYVDAFASQGYVVFKPDYRGHADSEGTPEGAYYSPAYATDVLNAVSSIKRFKKVNPEKIGMWGHSMGGNITLRNLVVSKDVKAAVIWAGVVGSYEDLMFNWRRTTPFAPSPRELTFRNRRRAALTQKYGNPRENPKFWNSVDPTYFVGDISAPVQLHHGQNDEEVPLEFSQSLKTKLEKAGKTVEYYSYPAGDHNISEPNFSEAMQRSVSFFDKYIK